MTVSFSFPYPAAAHFVFESLSYFVGFRLYLWRRKRAGDVVNFEQRMWVVAAAIAGAALGSKILNWFVEPQLLLRNWNNPYFLMSGKTVVGGLIGGLFAVEWAKRRIGVTTRTGDLFAIPLAVGLAIGRVGCFLAGLHDDTYGTATMLPWGIDFGDGIARHPTQLYEILFLALVATLLLKLSRKPHREGDLFRVFMVTYFAFRLAVDFLKPRAPIGGLGAIQWACAAMLIYYARDLPRLWRLIANSDYQEVEAETV
jgi:prolipoprotein diacylglyceryltransferase